MGSESEGRLFTVGFERHLFGLNVNKRGFPDFLTEAAVVRLMRMDVFDDGGATYISLGR